MGRCNVLTRRDVLTSSFGVAAAGVVATSPSRVNGANELACASSVLDFDDGSGDIGKWINDATASGCVHIYIPPGNYIQKTTLTSGQQVHLYTTNYSYYGYNPVTIKKDSTMSNAPHVEISAVFSSLGIVWDGAGVGVDAPGLILHKKFEFFGNVQNQSGDGLRVVESSGSHNVNSSVICGAFENNGGAGIIIDNTVPGIDPTNIDMNALKVPYLRCSGNRDGLVIRATLRSCFDQVNCKNNTRYGVHFDCTRAVQNNQFAIQAEGNSVEDVRVTDPNGQQHFSGNIFYNPLGYQMQDMHARQANVVLHGQKRQGMFRNGQQNDVQAFASNDKTNVTGNGTAYQVIFDTTSVDIHDDFDTIQSVFTTPVGGIYYVQGRVMINGLSGAHTRTRVNLVTTKRTYGWEANPWEMGSAAGIATLPIPGGMIDLDAGDTIAVNIQVENGNKTVTVLGSPSGGQSDLVIQLMG